MMTIRAMRETDVETVAGLEKEIFSQPWSVQGFLDALHQKDAVFLVAEEDEHIVGYLGMYIALDEAEITNVAAAPAQRRRGIGRRLLAEARKEAEKRKVTRILLEVRVSNAAAISLYEKAGFQKLGVRRGFYELPKEDAYLMELQDQ